MSETEVLLPVLSEDESSVVENFLESSKDLVPSVQVTLAKRILRPGLNRVLCMAARTSVPLNDDELASVSDLALRLSDGTNVKLSLSFFNDGDNNELVPPLKRVNYVPEHYAAAQAEPNFGQVIFATGLIAVTCFYYMAKSPAGVQANLFGAPKAPVALHHSGVSVLAPLAVKQPAPAKASAHAAPPTPAASKATAKAKASINFASHPRAEKSARIGRLHNDAFFVPPPPPITYTYPPRPMQFMPYMMESPSSSTVQTNSARQSPVKLERPGTAAIAKPSAEVSSTQAASDWLPSPAPSMPEKYVNRRPLPQNSIHKTIQAEAPSPGQEKGYPQLERIVLPGSN